MGSGLCAITAKVQGHFQYKPLCRQMLVFLLCGTDGFMMSRLIFLNVTFKSLLVYLAARGLRPCSWAFSPCGGGGCPSPQGLGSQRSALCRGAQAPGCVGSAVAANRALAAPRLVGSSQTGD